LDIAIDHEAALLRVPIRNQIIGRHAEVRHLFDLEIQHDAVSLTALEQENAELRERLVME